MVHSRSLSKRQERDIRHNLFTYSFQDWQKREIICTQYALQRTIENLNITYKDEGIIMERLSFEPGEVLVDCYGQGSFQKVRR